MSEPRMLCTYFLSDFYCLFQAIVRDVSASSHTVDYEMIKILELFIFLIRNMVHVCAVCYVTESVAKNRKLEMSSSDRDYLHSVHGEWLVIDYVYIPLWSTWVSDLFEGI